MRKRLPTVLALATVMTTPYVANTAGQPELVRTAINVLAFLVALKSDYAALAAAVVLVNQGSIVYVVALLLLVRRAWTLLALIPAVAWLAYIHWRPPISEWLAQPWSDFAHHPLSNALIPYASAHIGLHVALLDLLAVAGWPLLVATAVALWFLRNEIPRDRRTLAIAALVAGFVALQLVTAPFDTPNDPRRALPALLAISIAWTWAAARLWPRRAWRITIVALLVVCAFAAFSGVTAMISTPESIDGNPKAPLRAAGFP